MTIKVINFLQIFLFQIEFWIIKNVAFRIFYLKMFWFMFLVFAQSKLVAKRKKNETISYFCRHGKTEDQS